MANWKKVIVSGSNSHLNHITASGDISASGFLFGNLPLSDSQYVVVYNLSDNKGRLEYKELNLVNTQPAPRLFLADIHSDLGTDSYLVGDGVDTVSTTGFRLSYDTGSSSVGGNVYSYFKLSASVEANGVTDIETISLADSRDWVGINGVWLSAEDTDEAGGYYVPGTVNITGSILDERQPLFKGINSSSITINLQSINNTNNAVPAYQPVTYVTYGPRAFVDGGIGELRIYVNDNDIDSPARTIDLTNYDAITGDAGNTGVSVNLFATASNFDSINVDTPDTTKHYRSGSYTIGTNNTLQRDGYNFSFALHTGSKDGTDFAYITNFCEWFYDIEGANADLSIVDQGVIDDPIFTAEDTSSISGIKFFDSTAASNTRIKFGAKVSNQYRNIYPESWGIQFDGVTTNTIGSIQVTQSGQYQVETKVEDTSLTTNNNRFDLAELQNVSNAYTTDNKMTASLDIDFVGLTNNFYQPSTFLDGFTSADISSTNNEIAFTAKFDHIKDHKDISQVSCTTVNFNSYMVNNLSANANEYQFEDFKGEQYRIISRSYDVSEVANFNSTYDWDGEKNIINGGDGFNSGSIVYYSHLLYPTGAGNGGDFTTTLGPGNQPDYTVSAGGVGTREYYRYFKLTSIANSANQINIELVGSGKVVQDGDNTYFGNSTNDGVRIYIWSDVNGADFTNTFVNVLDSGIRLGSTLGTGNYISFASIADNVSYTANDDQGSGVIVPTGVVKMSDADADAFFADDYVIIKIVTPEDWTGNLDAMALTFGGSGTKVLGSTYTNL